MRTISLRSPYAKVGGLVFFGRLLDKIRLKGHSPSPQESWVVGFPEPADGRCVRFLQVSYQALERRAREGGSDDELLEWCFEHGRRPTNEDIQMWNAFMTKRGWRDDATETLEQAKHGAGFGHRTDIQTYFDLWEASGGPPAPAQAA